MLSSGDYKPVIVAYRNGAAVRASDVATIVDAAENSQQAAWMDRQPAVIVNIQRQPGANIIAVVDRIKKLLPQLQTRHAGQRAGEGADRPHDDDSRLGEGCGI